MPQAMARDIAKIAAEEDKTISELLRDAYREYKFRRDWAKIRRWGDEVAKRMGIETYDDVERIAG